MRHILSAAGPSLSEKVDFLSQREVWPHSPDVVEAVETHMSWVFLAGPLVYKLKKPIRIDVLDFSTLARRQTAVAEEVRLNRRLAPGVYLGARPLRLGPDGRLTLGPDGRVVDWLVEMRRLPKERALDAIIARSELRPADIALIASILVGFYRGLPPARTSPGRYVERFAVEQAETKRVLADPALAFGSEELTRALSDFDRALDRVRPLLEDRVRARRIIEGHGDLRPEHVFLTDPPMLIDCLEFNLDLRMVDPFDEITFLGLECTRLGADWAVSDLRDRLEAGFGDYPDPVLLAFYWRFRALLRARLALLHLTEPTVRTPAKWRPLASRYLTLAGEAEVRTSRR